MYCKYLDKSKFEVHYIGFDVGNTKRIVENAHVHYVPVHKNKLIRYWVYLRHANQLIRKEKFDLLFLVDCQTSLLVRLCNLFQHAILDIRTGDVRLTTKDFSAANLKIRLTSFLFKRITIISDSLRLVLQLPKNKCQILPLGGEQLNIPDKSFDTFRLFYIGTIHNRNIHQTIEALAIFVGDHTELPMHYDIVGFGSEADERQLRGSINKYQLDSVVTFHGRKNHDEVSKLFEECNIGLAYVPMTEGYNYQSTSKFYEYVFAGMPVIATNTYENKLVMSDEVGVLVDDNPEAVARGLEDVLKHRDKYNSAKIKETFKGNSWENIVKHNFEPLLESILEQE